MKTRLALLAPLALATCACGASSAHTTAARPVATPTPAATATPTRQPTLTPGTARQLIEVLITGGDPGAAVTAVHRPARLGASVVCSAKVDKVGRSFHFRVRIRPGVLLGFRAEVVGVDGASVVKEMKPQFSTVIAGLRCPRRLDLRRRKAYCSGDDPGGAGRVRIRVSSTPDGHLTYEDIPATPRLTSEADVIERSLSIYIRAASLNQEPVIVSCPGARYGTHVHCTGVRHRRGRTYHYRIDAQIGRPGRLIPHGLNITSPDDHTHEIT
jgi:hypothetical protein